jgi:hypothetical protein
MLIWVLLFFVWNTYLFMEAPYIPTGVSGIIVPV